MSLLELLIIVTGFVFVLFAIDLYQRRKFNLLHFLAFFGGTGAIVLFTLRPEMLESFGRFFGLARGADMIVYISIIGLGYLYFELLNKETKTSYTITSLVSQLTLDGITHQQIQVDKLRVPVATEKDDFVFLIRAYNEASTIERVIDTIIAAGFTRIVLVNDGSRDNTATLIQNKQLDYPTAAILLLQHPINRGGGAANKTLFAFVKAYAAQISSKRCVMFDADDQMNVSDMDAFMTKAKTGSYDILLGSRFVENGKSENMPVMRKVVLRGSRIVTYIFSGIRVTDPPNGYRVLTKDAVKEIHLESDGMNYTSDLLSATKKLSLRVAEVGVHIVYTDYSLSKGQKNSNALKILGELIYRTLFFK